MVTKSFISFIESKRGPNGLFSKTDLKDMKKVQQIYILNEMLGLDNKQIKLLNNLGDRKHQAMSLGQVFLNPFCS